MYNEELYTGFPQFLISFPQVLNSFPQDESYKPLQILQIVINLWKTICGKLTTSPIENCCLLVENYFSTGTKSHNNFEFLSRYAVPVLEAPVRRLTISANHGRLQA